MREELDKLSPLEALNKIAYEYGYDKNVEIINKALEQNITLNLANIELEHHLKLAEKELKALEIIKKKKVNMISLLSSIEWHNPSHYNDSVGCPIGCELTQEEYDLLKEVLL